MIKDIPGYEGLYQISNSGSVFRGGRERKQHKGSSGYYGVTLCKNGKTTRREIHRLVALCFVENPEKKPCVNHIDGDKENNHHQNLEWCTYSENVKHSVNVLGNPPPPTLKGKFGKDHNRSVSFKMEKPSGETVIFEGGLDFKRKTGLDNSSISYAIKKGLPHSFSRGGLKGWTLLELFG